MVFIFIFDCKFSRKLIFAGIAWLYIAKNFQLITTDQKKRTIILSQKGSSFRKIIIIRATWSSEFYVTITMLSNEITTITYNLRLRTTSQKGKSKYYLFNDSMKRKKRLSAAIFNVFDGQLFHGFNLFFICKFWNL